MSWQLGSFLVLALVLGAGFAWYERSRPPARVLSLVAALAALAVVGRLAFAAIPNVKPTTDIVLLAGWALGPVPGFAVGALTALASNVFLGHGPWTPWQMAAWGGVGAAGGAIGSLARGREPGRLPLAVVCGLAGLAFGAVMDVYQWTFAAERSPSAYLAISGTSLPYNVAHAVGNVGFCLLLGPPFLRAVERYRRRFEVRWPAPGPAVAAALLALLLLAPGAGAATPSGRALSYLERAQNRDGGWGAAPGQSSSPLYTGWTALGVAAAGRSPGRVRSAGRSALDYLRAHPPPRGDATEIQRTILVLRAAGAAPRRLGRRDLVRELLRLRDRDGSWDRQVSFTAFAVLALRAAGEPAASRPVRAAVRFMERAQESDGGFGVAPGAPSDVDDTGSAMQALAAGGRRRSAAVRRAIRYLRGAQNPDGGFGQLRGRPSNAQSTAWAVQGLVAAGRDPDRLRRSPLAYLRSLQERNGAFRYSRTSRQTPVWVTAQALAAIERRALPVDPVRRPRRARSAHAAAAAPARPRQGRRKGRRKGRRRPHPTAAAPARRETRPLPAEVVDAPRARASVPRGGGERDGPPALVVAAALLAAAATVTVARRRIRVRGGA